MTNSEPAATGDDRRAGERRRYNRRSSSPLNEAGPPYYEAFNRIATAMEAMQHSLDALAESAGRQRSSSSARRRLPDPPPSPRAG